MYIYLYIHIFTYVYKGCDGDGQAVDSEICQYREIRIEIRREGMYRGWD
jgi:hypothetical protein